MQFLSTLLLALITAGSAHDETPAKYYVYVTAESADTVSLVEFDAATKKARIAQEIEVGYMTTEIEGPHGLTISPDGEHWFVTLAHGKPYGILYKYKTGSNELVGQCELGLFPATMQISEATGLLYCVNFDLHGKMKPSTVSVVDPDAMVEVARTTTGPMPHGSRITRDGMRHYSCGMMSDELFEIDTVSFEVTRTLKLTIDDEEAMPMQAGHEGHGEQREQGEEGEHGEHGEHGEKKKQDDPHAGHDMGDHAAMGHAPPKAKPTWVFPHPTEKKVYVALNGAQQVVEVDTEAWKITRRFATDKGPYNVEVTPDGKKMAVTYKSAQGIGIWDLASGKELARLPSSRKITHGVVISDDSRYAFVSCEGIGGEMGTLDIVDMQSNELVTTVEIGLQAGGIYYWKREPSN